LATVGASRQDADVTSPEALHALLARGRPWAVVNATGYVRVDDAERKHTACFDVSAQGAANVAAACRNFGIRSFSSDLVFDGSEGRSYTEADTPRPLNVYGASKAAAERQVLDLMPQALVTRTSAFFGPWDAANFLAQGLFALRRGDAWLAAEDILVSPTYVPDRADATLDLSRRE
jgi:dTDP-4-dehydrorhamnose reductase